MTSNPTWQARDMERERLVSIYQAALQTGDEAKILESKNKLLLSVLPIIHYQAAKLRPGDDDFAQDATIYVASKLKFYRGAKRPGTSALGSNIKTWVKQLWTRDTSAFVASVSTSQIRKHRREVKLGATPHPLPIIDEDTSPTDAITDTAPSAMDLLLQHEDEEENHQLVHQLLATLTPDEATAIRFLHLEEMKLSDAGKKMGISTAKLKSLEAEAMKKLRNEE